MCSRTHFESFALINGATLQSQVIRRYIFDAGTKSCELTLKYVNLPYTVRYYNLSCSGDDMWTWKPGTYF